MDKYNHWLAKLICPKGMAGYAITLGQTAYYSCSESQLDKRWRTHEDQHKKQLAKDGVFKFSFLYCWYQIRHGYANNPFEV